MADAAELSGRRCEVIKTVAPPMYLPVSLNGSICVATLSGTHRLRPAKCIDRRQHGRNPEGPRGLSAYGRSCLVVTRARAARRIPGYDRSAHAGRRIRYRRAHQL